MMFNLKAMLLSAHARRACLHFGATLALLVLAALVPFLATRPVTVTFASFTPALARPATPIALAAAITAVAFAFPFVAATVFALTTGRRAGD